MNKSKQFVEIKGETFAVDTDNAIELAKDVLANAGLESVEVWTGDEFDSVNTGLVLYA